jgi:hypothetical protein
LGFSPPPAFGAFLVATVALFSLRLVSPVRAMGSLLKMVNAVPGKAVSLN